jgi:hypothetical protein
MTNKKKLELRRHAIRELSPRDMHATNGGDAVLIPIGWEVLPTSKLPSGLCISGCCFPPPLDVA